jgi:hypothetical protein
MRITVRLLAQCPVEKSTKVYVKTDRRGYPTIIPSKLREGLLHRSSFPALLKYLGGAILTILSIHRVFPTKVKPSLDTITKPFSGASRILDCALIKSTLKDLG